MTSDQSTRESAPDSDALDETLQERLGEDTPDREVVDAPADDADDAGSSGGDAASSGDGEDVAPPRVELAVEEDPRSKEELLVELQEAENDRDAYLDDLKRARAEFSNFRKRTMREGAEQRQAGATEVLGKLIDVLDDFELAVLAAENESVEPGGLRKGVEMVYGKLIDVCKSFGLEKVAEEGVAFDPEVHEAVQQVEAEEDLDEPRVAEVMRPGYVADGRVLRAAMVKVEQ